MTRYDAPDEDHQPMMWLRGHPIFTAYLIVFVFVTSMLISSVLMAAGSGSLLAWASFDSSEVLRGQVWRIFSYGLVNPPKPGWAILGFAIDMFMIGWFGRELERFFGRRKFLRFFVGLYLLIPLLFTAVGLRWPVQLAGESGAFAFFIAFTTIYPDVMMMTINVAIKWVALILVSLYSIASIAWHDWIGLTSFWAATTYAYSFVRFEQGKFTLPSINLWRRKPKLHLLPDLKPVKTVTLNVAKEDSMAEMDALLDKIACSGMSSLTSKERAQLAKARESMMQKKAERS